jgi:ATP-dependent Clp protease ATP-binding subunit ClpA
VQLTLAPEEEQTTESVDLDKSSRKANSSDDSRILLTVVETHEPRSDSESVAS